MGSVRQFTPVKLFIGVLVSNSKFIPEVEQRLSDAYGPVDHRSEIIPFDFTGCFVAAIVRSQSGRDPSRRRQAR